jgi:uncharacterized membrane protein
MESRVEHLAFSTPEETRQEMQAWLASFSPLLMPSDAPTETQVMQRLGTILDLKSKGAQLKMKAGDLSFEYGELTDTFRRALDQLPSLEQDTRVLLGALRPGDPRGAPNLDLLQDRLDEREARQEIGADTARLPGGILEMVTSPAQPAAGIAQAIMGVGMTCFVTLHMIMMIGGMFMAFGGFALLLLPFYGIFYAAAYGLFSSAFKAGAEESVRLEGSRLTVTRTLGPFSSTKEHVLDSATLPRIGRPAVNFQNKQASGMIQTAVILTDINAREVAIGHGLTAEKKESLRDKLSGVLKARRSLAE